MYLLYNKESHLCAYYIYKKFYGIFKFEKIRTQTESKKKCFEISMKYAKILKHFF